jgi:hypothetical protein
MASNAAARSSAPIGAQTDAEVRAGVSPGRPEFQEGDVRRYGASIDAADNSASLNAALLVSANGGSAAFIPAGRWKITKSLNAMHDSCAHGEGNASVIAPQGCDCLVFGPAGDYPVNGLSRFFRDFQIVGDNSVDSPHRAIIIDFASRSKNRVVGVLFENLYVANFGTGAHVRGLWFANFIGCHFYKCYRGICFVGENVDTCVFSCSFNRADIRGAGESWGISFESIDGESTQSTRIISTLVYFYDILVNVLLALELQIEHCDLSAAQSVGVQINTTMGGCWLKDCWIETDKASATTGVKVANVRPDPHARVHITGNYLTCDVAASGSRGINVGSGNSGVIVNDNTIFGFDQAITLGASDHLTCKRNRISCVTAAYGPTSHAILLDSSAADSEIGPNEIIPGKSEAAHMVEGNAAVHVADSTLFPVGTPIQFEADANGFKRGAIYFVLSSSANSLTVARIAGGSPISASGGLPVGAYPTPQPLIFTAGTPRGLSFFGAGSFIMSMSGFGVPFTGMMNWSASGKLLALIPVDEEQLIGTSNSASMTANGIPAFLWPASPQTFYATVRDAGVSSVGVAKLSASGELSFYRTPNLEPFTASGQKGITAQTMIYAYG